MATSHSIAAAFRREEARFEMAMEEGRDMN
jgi:hypothetical protein